MKKNVIMSSVTEYNNQKSAVKACSAERKGFKESTYTLTRLLNEMQTKEGWKYCEAIFAKCNLPLTRKLTKNQFLEMLPESQFVSYVSKGETLAVQLPAVTIRKKVYEKGADGKLVRDADGKKVAQKNADGGQVYTYSLKPVIDGQWTIENFVAVACNVPVTED